LFVWFPVLKNKFYHFDPILENIRKIPRVPLEKIFPRKPITYL